MKVRILYTDGLGQFMEGIYDKPQHSADEIVVESVMTGVCRSDVSMMEGTFPLLPLEMMGHEGLGIVHKVGDNIFDVKPGDYVATRGEPAYADLYNVRRNNYVRVDLLEPKYILEPVACGINLIYTPFDDINKRCGPESKILIIGSGFLAYVAYKMLSHLNLQFETLDVLGSSNSELFKNQISTVTEKYDIVIDISSKPEYLDADIYRDNGLLILAAEKFPDAGTNFSNLLWKNMTVKLPSPRSDLFLKCIHEANVVIGSGIINVDKFWTQAYNRDTEWGQAFSDALNRPTGYNRGYIKW